MIKKRLGSTAVFLLLLVSPANAVAEESALPVSPGGVDRVSVVDGRCPTFSWTEVEGAERYEILVYELETDSESTAPVLRRTVPGGALSWTPGRDACLADGKQFAWSIRAVAGTATHWSPPRLFRTEASPNRKEVGEALAVLEQYLENGGTLESLLAREPLAAGGSGEDKAFNPGAPNRDLPSSQRADRRPDFAKTEEPARSAVRALPDPAEHMGISSTQFDATGPSGNDATGVRGAFESTNGPDEVAGYLGVAVPPDAWNSTYLQEIAYEEIGVLGMSANSSADNWGVVGVGGEDSGGGRFLHADAEGEVDSQVWLARRDQFGKTWAMDVEGDMRVRKGSLKCPADTYPVGMWCITDQELTEEEPGGATWPDAVRHCVDKGMRLCPLDAIMACDHLNPTEAECGALTDNTTNDEYRIWLGDLPLDGRQMHTGLDEPYVRIFSHFAFDTDQKAWAYKPKTGVWTNWVVSYEKFAHLAVFCCTTPR